MYFTARAIERAQDQLAALQARRVEAQREYNLVISEVSRLENLLDQIDREIDEAKDSIEAIEDEIADAQRGRYELD